MNYSEYKRLLQQGDVDVSYEEWLTNTPQPKPPTLRDKLWECYSFTYKHEYAHFSKYKQLTKDFSILGFVEYLRLKKKELHEELVLATFAEDLYLLYKYGVDLDETLKVSVEVLFEGLPYKDIKPINPQQESDRAISGRMVGLWGNGFK